MKIRKSPIPVLSVPFMGLVVTGLFMSLSANAALITRLGGQAVYDTDLDITWIADANLATGNTFGLATGVSLGTHPSDSSGVNGTINADNGIMNWPGALFWIDAMNAANYLGFNDWRLPTTPQPDASCDSQFDGGSGDLRSGGTNCTGSEMGHLFHTELGGVAGSSILTSGDPDLALFTTIQTLGAYWSRTEFAPDPSAQAWDFWFVNGTQGTGLKGSHFFAWAVRSGDVGVVPVPAAMWLFGSALGILGWIKRKAG